MTPEQIAKLIVAELFPGGSPWILLILVLVASFIGAFFGKYAETKAQNLATREDFESLQKQLKDSTALVEGIRASFARTDWATKEWATIRIKKIEELMVAVASCESFLEVTRQETRNNTYQIGKESPFDKTAILAELYLPELEGEVSEYVNHCKTVEARHMIRWAMARSALSNKEAAIEEWEAGVGRWPFDEMKLNRVAIRREAAKLLQDTVAARAAH